MLNSFRRYSSLKECKVCGKESELISQRLGVCAECIHTRNDQTLPYIQEAHKQTRAIHDLPSQPPKTPNGLPCTICSNECKIGENERGFCGLRRNVNGRLQSHTNSTTGLFYSYLDPHVTNCCAAWFCPAGTGSGYPKYAYSPKPERGYYNLAVFLYGCNFNCLFCQNASHKKFKQIHPATLTSFTHNLKTLERVSCICYFGGSPEPQLPFTIHASRMLLEESPNKVLRICFEWNGGGNSALVKKAAELAYVSGGNIKFDLKCSSSSMNYALCGVSNEKCLENFQLIASEFYGERKNLPLLTATTLLVPGYVDSTEIDRIASFIANLDPTIPYSLLIFHPDYAMTDLPITPYRQLVDCYQAAKQHLTRVNVGNLNLLGIDCSKAFSTSIKEEDVC